MKSIIYIVNLHFWKSITGPFFAFGFPVIFIAILGTLLGYDQILGGILSIPIVTVSLTILPVALFEFKSSSLLKRIGVTSIKPWMFMLTISIYYICIMIIATIFALLVSMLIFIKYWNQGRLVSNTFYNNIQYEIYSPTFHQVLKNVNYSGFLFANLMNILVSTSLGLLISSISKSSLSIQGISIPILILSEFLTAQVLPIGMVKSIDALYYLSYISPFKYSTGQVIESWTGNMVILPYNVSNIINSNQVQIINMEYESTQNIFNVNQTFRAFYNNFGGGPLLKKEGMLIFNKVDKIANLIMPFIFTGLFSGIALKRFKWSNR